ncbi:MAG TPA: helix-turn-helix domain-containing protein, partial [Burkholderiaceae bacterium]|nr:helix-turn-helix domain-containing protein [Burkholderiaceae bacterium]
MSGPSAKTAASPTAALKERTAIQVIDRMMSLLDVLATRSGSVSLKDLAQATSLHPSTAHRILN